MNGESAYYRVIQYCPDRERAEAANIGVLLCAPTSKRVEAKVGDLSPRPRRFFGLNAALAAGPNAAAKSLEHLINSKAVAIHSLEELDQFVGTRANDVGLTLPRLVNVSDFAGDLEALFQELVETGEAALADSDTVPRPVVPIRLLEVFERLSRQGRVKAPGRIVVPIVGRELDIPYAYRNGMLNLVKPQVVRSGKRSENDTMQLATQGQLLEKHPDDGARRLIIVAGPGSTPRAEVRAAELFVDLGLKFVPQEQADVFAREVEEQAHE